MAYSHRPLSSSFSQNSDLSMFLIFRAVEGRRQVQIPRDICTRLGRYLYSTKLSWIIRWIIFVYFAFLLFACIFLSSSQNTVVLKFPLDPKINETVSQHVKYLDILHYSISLYLEVSISSPRAADYSGYFVTCRARSHS